MASSPRIEDAEGQVEFVVFFPAHHRPQRDSKFGKVQLQKTAGRKELTNPNKKAIRNSSSYTTPVSAVCTPQSHKNSIRTSCQALPKL